MSQQSRLLVEEGLGGVVGSGSSVEEGVRGVSAGPEGGRRPTGGSAGAPGPEVSASPTRRRFTAEYKLRIVREADRCRGTGEIGALLRREGLYSSHLVSWRRERDRAATPALTDNKRGRRKRVVDPRLKALEKENARLHRRLKTAETIIEFQKKVAELLGIPLNTPELDEKDS